MTDAKTATVAKTETKGKTEVSKQEAGETALVAAGTYADYAGAGFEGTTQEDYSIPFLTVLQALSPQVTGEAAIEGAKAGALFNTVTEEFVDGKGGLEFIPAHREQLYIEWVPRDNGGGFVGRHERTSEIVMKAKAAAGESGGLKTEAGNDLIQTAYIYGVVVHPDGRHEPVVMAFTSTKLKVYRHTMTKLNQFTMPIEVKGQGVRKVTPPIFAHRLKITTVTEKNNKGTFFNFKVGSAEATLKESLLDPKDERFLAALKLREMIHSGNAGANYEAQGEGGDDGKVPF